MRKRKRLKRIGWIILALFILLSAGSSMGWFSKPKLTEVEAALVTRQTIVETVSAIGKIQPSKEVKISGDISGEIIELPVKEGDKVKRGQLLARIKPDQYQRGVEKANAGVNSARAQISNSEASQSQAKAGMEKLRLLYNRQKHLYEQNAISKADFENVDAEYKVAQAQLEGAEHMVEAAKYGLSSAIAAQKEAQDLLRKTEIYAPMDGSISKLNRALGERVVGTMQMEGTEMMRVANLAEMEVQVEVNENDIIRIALGDTADIKVDAYRNEVFKGVVTEISSSSQSGAVLVTEKVTNFLVKVKILESSYKHLMAGNETQLTPFRPGMSATVTIRSEKVENAVSVPVLAVTVRNDKNLRDTTAPGAEAEVVFIYSANGIVKQRKVVTGIQDDMYIVIKEGLKEGETVIKGPYNTVSKELKDGDKVTLKIEDKTNGRKS